MSTVKKAQDLAPLDIICTAAGRLIVTDTDSRRVSGEYITTVRGVLEGKQFSEYRTVESSPHLLVEVVAVHKPGRPTAPDLCETEQAKADAWNAKQWSDYPDHHLAGGFMELPHVSAATQRLRGYRMRLRLANVQANTRGLEGAHRDAYVAAHMGCPPHTITKRGTMKAIDMDAIAAESI